MSTKVLSREEEHGVTISRSTFYKPSLEKEPETNQHVTPNVIGLEKHPSAVNNQLTTQIVAPEEREPTYV